MRVKVQVLGICVLVIGILSFALPAQAEESLGCDQVAVAKVAAPAGCYDSGDCATGSTCKNGRCVPDLKVKAAAPAGCFDSGDCATGSTCKNGRCVPDLKAKAAAPAGCFDSGDCATGSTCINGRCVPDP
jgi:hypothetical protein